jgi:Transcriptional regulator
MRKEQGCGDEPASLRLEVLTQAKRLFLKYGYSGASIAMIAEELGVTKAALYYHFPDKESLFLAVFDDYLRGIACDLAEAGLLFGRELDAEGSALRAFAALARVFVSRGPESVRMNELAFQEAPALSEGGRAELGSRYHRDLVGPVEDCFRRAADASWLRAPREGEPPRVWLFMGTLSAFFSPGHAPSAPLSADEIERSSQLFASLLLEGLIYRN